MAVHIPVAHVSGLATFDPLHIHTWEISIIYIYTYTHGKTANKLYTHMYKHADTFLDQLFLVYAIQMAHSSNEY